MGKLLFWALIIVGVLIALRIWNIMQRNAMRRDDDAPRRSRKSAQENEPMVRCVRCGVFLPRAEARLTHDGYHCTEEKCNRHS